MTKHLDGTDGTLLRTTTAFTHSCWMIHMASYILLTVERKASRYDQMIDRDLFNTKSRNFFPYMILVLRAVIGRY